MAYDRRRYRVVNGVLEKSWQGEDSDGWVRTKAEALGGAPELTPVNWNAPWLSVRAALKAHGFEGKGKAEALVWAREKGWSVP